MLAFSSLLPSVRILTSSSRRIRNEVLYEEHLDRYVDSIKGARIRYRYREAKERSSQKRVFALLAGWTCSPAAFIPIIPYLNAENDIITMENRGHWRSTLGASTAETYLSDLAHDLKAVLDKEQVAKVVLVAHSMWGISALKFYQAFKDRVEGIIFICPALTNPLELWSFGNSVAIDIAVKSILSILDTNPVTNITTQALAQNRVALTAVKRIAEVSNLTKNGHGNDLAFDRFIQQVLATDVKTRTLALRAMMMEKTDKHVLAGVDTQVMLITGGLDWLIVHEKVSSLARIMPGCERVIKLPNVAHVPPLEVPDVTANLIQDFTRRLQ